MRLLTVHEILHLHFGEKIVVEYSPNEKYVAVAYGDKIGYNDGKSDRISLIADQVMRDICSVQRI